MSDRPEHKPTPPRPPIPPALDRYSRQVLFEPVGEEGQRRLAASRVTIIGCGALGSATADQLVRAGVGFVRIVDRDVLELNNLQRQTLFDEQDVRENLPKAEAARRKLARVNSEVTIEAFVADANPFNIESFLADADVVLDGTDNFETRFLINDAAVKLRKPWVYGACVAASGLVLPILPRDTPCLRCVFEHAPPPEMNPTCDTVGVLAPVVLMVSSHQVIQAMKILIGKRGTVNRKLLSFDAWTGRVSHLNVEKAREAECPCCKLGRYEFLQGRAGGGTASLCGRNAVQVSAAPGLRVDLQAIADRLARVADAQPEVNAFLLRARIGRHEITVFADGRAIIKGTSRMEEARSLYARYVGA